MVVITGAWILSNIVLKPKVLNNDKLYQREVETGRLDERSYMSWDKTEFLIPSRYGYSLACQLLKNKKSKMVDKGSINKMKIAVLCHGYTCGQFSSMMYADMFLRKGIMVVTYDHRNHGKSGKAYTSMGYFEKFDLQTVVDWCYSEFGPAISIVTHGESMGAATVLSHHAIDGRVRCTIADCSYASLDDLLKYQLKTFYHIPIIPFFIIAKLMIRLRGGFWTSDVKPIDAVVNSNIPTLFIHGDADDFVPYTSLNQMYDAKTGNKEKYLCPGAEHAKSCQNNRKEYEKVLYDFLDMYYFVD